MIIPLHVMRIDQVGVAGQLRTWCLRSPQILALELFDLSSSDSAKKRDCGYGTHIVVLWSVQPSRKKHSHHCFTVRKC